MAVITTRAEKGTLLTSEEVDANFTGLNDELATKLDQDAPLTVHAVTGAYTVVAADANKVIHCTNNSFTVTLTAAATLGTGFRVSVWNSSTGIPHVITIDAHADETIDGVATLLLRRGEGVELVCTGTGWIVGNKRAMRGYAENISPTQARAVASEDGAVALGMSVARGIQSFAAGIASVDSTWHGALSAYSVALGYQARTRGIYSTALGYSADTQGAYSVAIGDAYTDAPYSTAIGTSAYARTGADHSIAIGRNGNTTRYAQIGFSGSYFNTNGDMGMGLSFLRARSFSAIPVNMSLDGAANYHFTLRDNLTCLFQGTLVARNQDTDGESMAWEFKGMVRRDVGAASVKLVGTPSINLLSAEGGVSWGMAISADTTNGNLVIAVTGEAGKTINWVAPIWATELVC